MPMNRASSVPPPTIGKIGRYTVFITPPSTPTPPPKDHIPSNTPTQNKTTPNKISNSANSSFSVPTSPSPVPSPIQSPPVQFDKPTSNAAVGFFWDSVTKVQNAHSSLDDHLARWFGLNQSKYQWALDDYYESKEVEKDAVKSKEAPPKVQTV